MIQASTIEIRVNGEDRRVRGGVTVSELLAELGTAGKRVAVECNGQIVPRSQYGSTLLATGDQLEIVIAVGGG